MFGPGPPPESVASASVFARPSEAILRDPRYFVPGELHRHVDEWKAIPGSPPDILKYVTDKVDAWEFIVPFQGVFAGQAYNLPSPPPKVFQNNRSCVGFESFITDTILERVGNGSLKFWGRVGEVEPPHLVMPITIEPNKPRMCHDERFLNLWVKDSPFSLDHLADLPRYVGRQHYQSVCDDKSGYDHILLTEESQALFGVCWNGCYFVYRTLPFGWKASAYIYHTVGLIATGYIRSLGVPCSQYIDDRHFGQLTTASSCRWSDFMKAEAAAYIAVSVLTLLGYTLALSKSHLKPSQAVKYLGYISDSNLCAFVLPEEKKVKFRELREEILASQECGVKKLQKFAGKTSSFSVAVPAARLYSRACFRAISKASKNSRSSVKISGELRKEISYWRFLDSWEDCLPWFPERHQVVNSFTDASKSGWGASLSLENEGTLSVRDYWSSEDAAKPIVIKEALAILYALRALRDKISNSRVDCRSDNLSVIQAWNHQGCKNKQLSDVIKEIYEVSLGFNIILVLSFVPSKGNIADFPSRVLSPADAMLAPDTWGRLQSKWGPHSVDLMALDSNVQRNRDGCPLKHFSPWPTEFSKGVNVFAQTISPRENAYVFPPLVLVGPVLRFLSSQRLQKVTVVVPDVQPRRYWWALLVNRCKEAVLLGRKGSCGPLLFPTRGKGFEATPLSWDLWAFRLWN